MSYPKWKADLKKQQRKVKKQMRRDQDVPVHLSHEHNVYMEWDQYKQSVKPLKK